MNFLLKIAFNGTAYHGFQVQKNALGVCTVIQDAMEKVLGARPDVKGCSRTDAGVHAREYCISFRFVTSLTPRKMPLAFNRYLPPDIRVLSAQRVPDDFHARYSALGKEYHYVLFNSFVDDPFAPGLYYRLAIPLDEEKMQQGGNYLLGKHDFASFMSAGSDIQDTVRTITSLQVTRQEQRVTISVAADGFLYNMVRIIAGTLVQVGNGRILPEDMPTIIQGKNRSLAGDTMAAQGLFLNKVFYPPEALAWEE